MAQRGSPETVKRKELVGKLNPTCLKAFSEAAGMAKARGNPYVELAHFIDALSRTERTDFDIICRSAGVDGARLEGDIQRSLDKLPHGASAVEEFSTTSSMPSARPGPTARWSARTIRSDPPGCWSRQ